MEDQFENERIVFINNCETMRTLAKSMGSLLVESLKSEKLSNNERPGRISYHLKEVEDEIEAINRPDYFSNWNNYARVYELFKNTGNLTNTEELNKLQQVMIFSEKYLQLTMLSLDLNFKDHPAKRKKISDTADSEQDALNLHRIMVRLQDLFHVVVPPSDIHDLIRIVTCHDWSTIRSKIYFGCHTNELKCIIDCFKPFNPDLTYANIDRCGLLISKSGTTITAHNLSATSYDKLKTRSEIMKIIAAYKKKA